MPESVLGEVAGARLLEELEEWFARARPELVEELRQRAEEIWSPFSDSVMPLTRQISLYNYCLTKHVFNWLEDYPELLPGFVMHFSHDQEYDEMAVEVLVA